MSWSKRSGGAPVAAVPAVQPNLYSAEAMWALQLSAGLILGTDRSGNAKHLSNVTAGSQKSNIPATGRFAPANNAAGMGPSASALAPLTGAQSVTCVVNFGRPAWTADQWIYAQADFTNNVSGSGNALLSLLLSGTTHTLTAFHQNGAASTSSVVSSTLVTPTDGLDHFVSVARSASGLTYEFGIDGVYQTPAAALTAPSLGSISKSFVGCRPVPVNLALEVFCGGIEDVCVWPATLTQAQVQALRVVRMGL